MSANLLVYVGIGLVMCSMYLSRSRSKNNSNKLARRKNKRGFWEVPPFFEWSRDFVTAESFRRMCDVEFGMDHLFLKTWNNPRLIYCSNELLYMLLEKKGMLLNKYVLVTGPPGKETVDERFIPLLEDENLAAWFCVNPKIFHSKLHLVPVGIGMEKSKLVQAMEDYSTTVIDFVDAENCSKVSKGKFALLPNTFDDCPRLWECYYLGCIPVLPPSPLTDHLKKLNLPFTTNFDKVQLLKNYSPIQPKLLQMTKATHFERRIKKELISTITDKSMSVAYSFHGTLPAYSIDTVIQLRKFYSGPVYFIVSDIHSVHVPRLREELNVTIVDIKEVESRNAVSENSDKFVVMSGLKGRERLFQYSFERFYLLEKLMERRNLKNVFFLELDNLIYHDPHDWIPAFSLKPISYMYDGVGRFSSGVFFAKDSGSLRKMLESFTKFIENFNSTDKSATEMIALYEFYESNKNLVQVLPTHWETDKYPKESWENFTVYGDSIFDAASVGIYLGGLDSIHTGRTNVKGARLKMQKNDHEDMWASTIDYTGYEYKWERDRLGRNIPFVKNPDTGRWIRMNNLHIHSKDLRSCFS